MGKKSKLLLIIVFIITAALAGAAVWIGWRLSKEKEVTPEEGKAWDTGIDCPTDYQGQTHCNTDSSSQFYCHDMLCRSDTGTWDDQGECGSVCTAHADCSSVCGGTTTTTTISGGRCDSSNGTCWFPNTSDPSARNSMGRCCVDGSGCYISQICTHDVVFDLDSDATCPDEQMVLCGTSGPECTTTLCPPCEADCPSGWYPCDCDTPGAVGGYRGTCEGCDNDYWGCCCQQETTTTTTTTTTSSSTTTTSSSTSSTSSTSIVTTSTTTTSTTTSTTTTTSTSTTTTTSSTTTTTSTTIMEAGIFDEAQKKIYIAFILIIIGSLIFIIKPFEHIKFLSNMIDIKDIRINPFKKDSKREFEERVKEKIDNKKE